MLTRLLGAMALAALVLQPVQSHAMASRADSTNNRLATCVLSLIVIGLPLGCKGARLSNAKATKAGAQVTIHKPEGGKCANGNEYRIMRVSDPYHVCKNSIRGGSSVPACVNMSTIRGQTVGLIILKTGSDRWKAHEIDHVCRGN